jgi:hypothetical protein
MTPKTILLQLKVFRRVLASGLDRSHGRALGVCALQDVFSYDLRRSCVCYFHALSFRPRKFRVSATGGSHREHGRRPFACCDRKPFHFFGNH